MPRLKCQSTLAPIKCQSAIYTINHVFVGSDAASVLALREIWMLQKSVAIGAWRTLPVPLSARPDRECPIAVKEVDDQMMIA
jgi:hypothetical protein